SGWPRVTWSRRGSRSDSSAQPAWPPVRTSTCRSTSTASRSTPRGTSVLNKQGWNSVHGLLRSHQFHGGDAMVNKVILVGNLAADPDVKATAAGMYIAKMRLATNTYAGKDESGNRKQHS